MKPWEYRNITFSERVRMHIVKSNNGCHEFAGRKDSYGYGQIKDKGKAILVHRWIWEQENGKTKMQVLHSCDNPSCVKLSHLHLGSHADNMREKSERGRSNNVPRGASHKRPMAKITEKQARDIKNRIKRGHKQVDIANDYDLSSNLVSEIKLGKTWSWI